MNTHKCTEIEIRYRENDESALWMVCRRETAEAAGVYSKPHAGCTAPVKDDRLAQKLAHFGRRIALHPSACEKECRLVKELLPRLKPAFEELHKVRGKLFPFSMAEVDTLLTETEKYLRRF